MLPAANLGHPGQRREGGKDSENPRLRGGVGGMGARGMKLAKKVIRGKEAKAQKQK